ncbi:acyltransferase [Tateyamaria omphalii]|uniref:acyltransferase family protein n=1 Tax=Tateyamaria omphalii TaxID=299262 RepID=UPI001673A799|nr:acyltransferase [Tateyamaria omphalii]GGX58832.1 acyltransferase [Tateyamaria omphalii]
MTRGLSLWLDALRVAATLLVVFSHVAYARFTRGDYEFVRDLNVGSDAVIVFFVISGLVIAFAAERDKTLGTYAFNRLTRLLSVLLPALALTFILDQIGRPMDVSAYPDRFYQPLPLWEMLARGLTMSNEWGLFERVRLGTNGPLWSLSYEAAYYVLFGVAVFCTGVRRVVLLAALAIVFGPRILLLMPAWLMGVAVWHFVKSGGAAQLSAATARILAWGGPLAYILCQTLNVPDILANVTAAAFAPGHYRFILVFSDEFIWNTLIGLMTALHVIGMARLAQGYQGAHPHLRWWAGASFSIYVVHYPVLHLIDAAFPTETMSRDALLFFGSVAAGLVFAQVFERPIGAVRQAVRNVGALLPVTGRRQNPPHPQATLLPETPAQQR